MPLLPVIVPAAIVRLPVRFVVLAALSVSIPVLTRILPEIVFVPDNAAEPADMCAALPFVAGLRLNMVEFVIVIPCEPPEAVTATPPPVSAEFPVIVQVERL